MIGPISTTYTLDVSDAGTKFYHDGSDWAGFDSTNKLRIANRWPITALNSSMTITAIEVRVYIVSVNGSPGSLNINRYGTSHGEDDPSTDSGGTVYSNCGGTNYSTFGTPSGGSWTGWVSLGATAISDLTWCVANGHSIWSIGLVESPQTESGVVYYDLPEDNEANPAELRITVEPTRIYLPSSGAAAVTPSTWNFPYQVATTYTLPGVLSKSSTALTTRTCATGTVSGRLQAHFRYIIGPLDAYQIFGNVNLVMRCYESATGANATLGIAVKIVQPDGTDRSVLLAYTASDSATSTYEFTTTLSTRRAYNASEVIPIPLTPRTPNQGDYLVIEIGFRSATTTSRNLQFRHGDTGANDCPDSNGDTNDYCPWVEFDNSIPFYAPPETATANLDGLLQIIFKASGALDGKLKVQTGLTNLLDGKLLLASTDTGVLDGKAIIKSIKSDLLDGKLIVLSSSSDVLDGKVYVNSASIDSLDGMVLIKTASADLYDGKLILQSAISALLDGTLTLLGGDQNSFDGKIVIGSMLESYLDGRVHVVVSSTGTVFIDGKVAIIDSGSNVLDGKLLLYKLAINTFDGAVRLLDKTTNIADGKIIVKSATIVSLDGKVIAANTASVDFDGLVKVSDSESVLFNGRAAVRDSISNNLDGKIIIANSALSLLDGTVFIKTGTANLLDGMVDIKNSEEVSVDGKIVIKTAFLTKVDGKVLILGPGEVLNNFDGKIEIEGYFLSPSIMLKY